MPRVRRLLRCEFFSPRLNRAMTQGEVGCTLSHVRALRAIVTRDLPHAIILEDDVAFTGDFTTFVRLELPQLLSCADVIKLEGIRDHRSSRSGLKLASTSVGDLFVPLRPALGSAGYAVNARGARLLFKAFKRIDRPLDHRLAAYDQHGAVFAEFSEFPVYQDGEHSNIKAERQQAVVRRHSAGSFLRAKGRVLSTAARRSWHLGMLILRRRKPLETVGSPL
jgi:glycosyl transferase family 25